MKFLLVAIFFTLAVFIGHCHCEVEDTAQDQEIYDAAFEEAEKEIGSECATKVLNGLGKSAGNTFMKYLKKTLNGESWYNKPDKKYNFFRSIWKSQIRKRLWEDAKECIEDYEKANA